MKMKGGEGRQMKEGGGRKEGKMNGNEGRKMKEDEGR